MADWRAPRMAGRPGWPGWWRRELPVAADRSAFAECLPARLSASAPRSRRPSRRLRPVVNPPQTNIKSSPTGSPASIRRGPGHRRRHCTLRRERPLHRREQQRRRSRGAALEHVREPGGPEGRLEAGPERHRVHRRRSCGRRSAARRPTSTSALPQLQVLASQRARSTSSSPGREAAASVGDVQTDRKSSMREQVASANSAPTRSAAPHAASLSQAPSGRLWQCSPPFAAFLLAVLPDPLVGREARARAGHAQGARLDAMARRAPGAGRVARPGRLSAGSSAWCSVWSCGRVRCVRPTLTASSRSGRRFLRLGIVRARVSDQVCAEGALSRRAQARTRARGSSAG